MTADAPTGDGPAESARPRGEPPFDPDDLVRHARFVKSLARELARDDDEAEELAARTLETALVRRPAGGGSLRVWLKRVVERVFFRTRRDDARRRRREEATAPREATAATVDDVARLELERKVAAAFAALAEPYRTTLFLRYFDDLRPREIAARMDVPVETVQTRTKRGLARLREQLDAEHGGRREAWHAGAIALAAARGPVVTTVNAKLAVAAAGLVLMAGGGWLATRVARVATGGDATRSAAAVSAGTVAAAASASSKVESSRGTDASRALAADGPPPLIAGIVVDEAGAPVEGAAIVPAVINRDDARNYFVEELHVDRAKTSAIAWSDASGRFRVDATPRDCVGIHVWKEGLGVGEAYDLAAERVENQEVRIVLSKAAAIRGRIRDSEGRPIHFTLIRAHDAEFTTRKRVARNLPGEPNYCSGQRWNSIRVMARIDGSFEIAEIPAGPFQVLFDSWGYEFEGRSAADATTPLDVVLRRSSLLVDVFDVRTHEPIDEVRALVSPVDGDGPLFEQLTAFQERVPQGADDISPRNRVAFSRDLIGCWKKEAKPDRGAIRIRLVAAGHHTRAIDVELSRSQEPPHLAVELEPGEDEPSLTGRVVGAAHAHVDVRFSRRGGPNSGLQHEYPLRSVDCEADGRFALAELPPATYRLFLSAPGCGQRWFDVDVPAHDVSLELKPAAAVEARVVNAAGESVAGVAVLVQTVDEERSWVALTDANGTAIIDELPDGEVLVAALRYWRDLHVRPYALLAQRFPADARRTLVAGERVRVELPLSEKRPIALRIRDARANPVSDALVRFAGITGSAEWQEPGFDECLYKTSRDPMRVEGDGSLHLDLFPSRYVFEIDVDGIVQRSLIDVTAKSPAVFDICLPIRGPVGAIHGRAVEFGSGRPMASAQIMWADGDGSSEFHALGSTSTDAEGRFTFERVPAGTVVVAAYGPQGSHGSTAKRVTLPEGDELTLELPVGRFHPDDPAIACVATEITVVDDSSGAPIEGAYVFFAAEVDGANVYLGDFKSDHDGRACDRVTAAASYAVSTGGPFPPRAPFEALYEKARITVEPADGMVRATIRLHRKP